MPAFVHVVLPALALYVPFAHAVHVPPDVAALPAYPALQEQSLISSDPAALLAFAVHAFGHATLDPAAP